MMVHSGTAKVGIKLSGSSPIDAIGCRGREEPERGIAGQHAGRDRAAEIEQASEVEPENASPPVRMAIDHGQQHEHRGDADRHVAQSRREREQRRTQVEGVEKQECAAEHAPGLHGGQQPQIQGEREAPEGRREAIGEQE